MTFRWGFFGGSFDPPHLGHALACLWALETGEVDRIIMVPVFRHAFAKEHGATFDQRLEMCRLAVLRLGENVIVSDLEAGREEVSYTVDTLRALADEFPGDSFRLVIGGDVAADLPKWRESGEVTRLAPPLLLPRPLEGGRFVEHPGALPAISSTDVRERLAAGLPVDHLVGATVRAFITQHQIYRTGGRPGRP